MKLMVTKSYEESAKHCAELVLAELSAKPDMLLGLATGESMTGVYDCLAAAYAAGTADFARVRSVNLDEYIGCAEPDSYRYFMEKNLFSRINIPAEHITIADYRAEPEEEIARLRAFFAENRVDIQLLGMGGNGHIGFNEPGDCLSALTHRIRLTEETIRDNARFFASPEQVPLEAITMGMADILQARKLVMLVKGEGKRDSLRALLESGSVTTYLPASFLRLHPDATLIYEETLA